MSFYQVGSTGSTYFKFKCQVFSSTFRFIMWDTSSSGFGDDNSPVLSKPIKKFLHVGTSQQWLKTIHKNLMIYLERPKDIPRKTLLHYKSEVDKIKVENCNYMWLLMEIKGLLNYILKKRSEFQKSIIKGEIMISARSQKPAITSSSSVTVDMPFELLTNDNFATIDEGSLKMDTEEASVLSTLEEYIVADDCTQVPCVNIKNEEQIENNISSQSVNVENNSEDLFSQSANILMEDLTLTPDPNEKEVVGLFKVPIAVSFTKGKIKNNESLSDTLKKSDSNIFYDIKSSDLVNVFDRACKEMKNLLLDIVDLIQSPELDENAVSLQENENIVLNTSTSSIESVSLKPCYSEENFAIIRESSAKFKENLDEKTRLELEELLSLSSSNLE